jgi:hypothetical protein
MAPSPPPDAEISYWLHTLGVSSLCQWEVLVFLYHHQVTLLTVADLARLLGYASHDIGIALDTLVSEGLVVRSGISQGVRLYQCNVPLDSPRGAAFARLQTLATDRAGCLRQQMRQHFLLVVCAWCTKSLRWQYRQDTVALQAPSHSICPTCLKKVLSALERVPR